MQKKIKRNKHLIDSARAYILLFSKFFFYYKQYLIYVLNESSSYNIY
jgi:hypothetical protein